MRCCGLYESEYFLASDSCAGEDNGVICTRQVPLAAEPRLRLGVVLHELCLDVVHDGAVDYEEQLWRERASLSDPALL